MEIVQRVALISINATFFVQLISFLLFLFVINRIMFKPLLGVMDKREEHIEDLEGQIQTSREKLDDINALLFTKEEAAREEADIRNSTLDDEGSDKAKALISTANEEISALRKATQAKVDKKVDEARAHLEAESDTLCIAIMEKILDRRPG